jgi:hypothetical protein
MIRLKSQKDMLVVSFERKIANFINLILILNIDHLFNIGYRRKA